MVSPKLSSTSCASWFPFTPLLTKLSYTVDSFLNRSQATLSQIFDHTFPSPGVVRQHFAYEAHPFKAPTVHQKTAEVRATNSLHILFPKGQSQLGARSQTPFKSTLPDIPQLLPRSLCLFPLLESFHFCRHFASQLGLRLCYFSLLLCPSDLRYQILPAPQH